MNTAKQNLKFMIDVSTLSNKEKFPIGQRGCWDLIEQESIWTYDGRNEDIVFFTHTQEPVQHFLRGLVVSVAKQVDVEWD